MSTIVRRPANLVFRKAALPFVLISASALAGCATYRPPEISYDDSVPPLPTVERPAVDERPRSLHTPPAWTVARGGQASSAPTGQVENANVAARVEPRREGYYNAIQIYPWSEGALYQVYAAPGQITNIALEPGEALTGAGPIAAGDTARWIIGDTESGSGTSRRVHILVKPTRPDIVTNLIITTDRRTYMIELRSRDDPYMPAVAWAYPQPPVTQRATPTTPRIPAASARHYRYGLPALASGLGLRRRETGLHRLPSRDRTGRDAAALRPRLGWRAGNRQQPHLPKHHDRGPHLRGGRATAW